MDIDPYCDYHLKCFYFFVLYSMLSFLQIDLQLLCDACGWQYIEATVTKIDYENKLVDFKLVADLSTGQQHFDLLSINLGSITRYS